MGLAVERYDRHDAGGEGDGGDFEAVEGEAHGVAQSYGEKDEHGSDEERDLGARAHGDRERQVDLVLGSDEDGGPVLGRVADEGDDDHTEEELADAEARGRILGDAHEDLGQPGDENRGRDQRNNRAPRRPLRWLIVSLRPEQLPVSAESEHQAQHVDEEHHPGDKVRKLMDHLGVGAGV